MKRILFIDDEPMVLQGLKSKLYRRRGDWDLSFAEGGVEGVASLQKDNFDVIVTDLRMPGVDGVQVLKEAREHRPGAIRIVFSGSTDDQQTARLLSLAQQYLNKPCEPGRLEQMIERCFATQMLIGDDAIRERLGGIRALPPLPRTYSKLQTVLADERADMKAIARVVESDAAIVAKILQVVNSAFFRLPRRASSVEQAVTHLGACAIRDLVLGAELFQAQHRLPPGIDPQELQRHAYAVGCVARMVGRGKPFADDCFLAGLIHDIGRLLLGSEFPDETAQVIAAVRGGENLTQAENRIIGIDHARAGAYLLGVWGLSYDVIEAVAHHHAPQMVKQDGLDVLATVSIAIALVAEVEAKGASRPDPAAAHVGAEYAAAAGLDTPWDTLLEQAAAVLADGAPA